MVGALLGAGISIIGGLIKTSQARKREDAIQADIDAYKRENLVNAADALTVDTTAIDINAKTTDRYIATGIEALSKAGSRGLVGGLPKLEETLSTTKEEATKEVARQRQDINKLRVQEEADLRKMREARDIADLQGLGNALSVSTQDKQAGMGDIFSGLGTGFSALTTGGVFDGLFGSKVLPASTGTANA